MNTSDGTLSFATAIDTSGYEKGIDRLRSATETMSQVIAQQFGSVASLSEKYGELSKICESYDNELKSLSYELDNYKKIAQEAFMSGDIKSFDDATAKIKDLETQMVTTADEAQGYADALALVSQQMGMISQTPAPPMFFTEEQLMMVDSLNERLDYLNEKIAERPDESTYNSLKAEISDVTAQISVMEKEAAKAASELGSDLGARASEASANLHNLNIAIQEQESACKKLEMQTSAASAELQTLKDSMASEIEVARAQAAYDGYSQSLHQAHLRLIALQGAQNDARDALTRVTSEVESHNSVIVKMLGGYEKYTQVVSNMPAPLQTAIAGINGMTGAAKAFIATPLGAVIAAITLAVQAMMQWFNSSVEGQLKFAEISGYVSGILGQLKEVVISVGKAIYEAFTNPKKAASQFLDFLKSQVVNRVKALGDVFGSLGNVIANVFTGDFDQAKVSLKDMGNAYADFVTGVENTTGKLSSWSFAVSDAANATAQISRATKELQMEASRWQQSEIEYGTKMNELYTMMMDNSLSKEQRKKYKKDYEDLVQLVSDQKVALAQKAVELQQQKMSLTTNSIEDEMELDSLNNALAQAQGYKAERMRMLQRMENRLNTSSSNPLNRIDKADQQAQRQMERALQDVEYRTAQAKIDAMSAGEEKVLAQMKLNHQRELDELQRQKEDYLQKKIDTERAKFEADPKNKEKHFNSGSISLTDTETALFDQQRTDILKKQEAELEQYALRQAESMNEYLARWGEYLQKRQALIDIANAKLNNPDSNLAEGEKLAIKAQLKKDLADVDKEELKKSLNWEEVFGNLNAVATASLQSMKKKLQEFIKTNKDLKPDEIKDLVEAIEKIDDKLNERDPFKALQEDFKSLKDAIEKARQAQEAYNKALKEGSEQEQEQAKQAYEQALNAKQKAQAEATKSLQAAAGQVSELLQMVNAVVGCIESFGVDVPEQILGFLDGMGSAVESLASIDLTRPMSIITGFAGAIGNVVKGIGSLFNNDSGHEKKIKRIQNQIDALSKSYESLADKIEEAYSKDASQLIEQQNKILEQKKALIQQQINEEKAKKKTDNDRIKEWESQIEDINKAIADNKQKALDAIFGEDLKSAIENFASAYADAWAQGENRAKSAKDTVKNMMRQMVQESIKAAIQSGGAMERIREQLQAFYADNVLSGWEQDYIYKMAESLQQELDSQFAWADSLLKDNSFQQSGSSGGFQAMSEDTGTELNGRFTAMQIAMEDIRSISDGIKTDTSLISDNVSILRSGMEEMQSIALLQLGQLEAISRNTKGIADMGETLERIERNTQKL